MDRGFIKIFRKLSDNPLWMKKPFSDGQAWVDLLMIANYKAGIIDKRGLRVKVERGQVGYSTKGLADRWGWSRGKVGRFLKYLENEHQIEQQKSNVTTLITLTNYETYNETNTRTDHKRTADEPQADTNKNEKKVKNEKKGEYGQLDNVRLSFKEFDKLTTDLTTPILDDYIERLSLYIPNKKPPAYKDHNAVIRSWWTKDKKDGKLETPKTSSRSFDDI